MNIFYLDHNVTTCAKYHVDKHCVKMILEIPRGLFTEPPCCMPDECKNSSTIESYRNYYLMAKSHIFAWKNRAQPLWINSNKCCVV